MSDLVPRARAAAATVDDAAERGLAKLRTRFDAVRAQSLALIAGLSAEDCALQSMPDASPVPWHLAHTTWFFEVFALERFEPGFQPFHPAFRMLFNSYCNGVGDKHLRAERGLVSRPGLAEVLAYRENVEARLRTLLRATPGGEGDRAAFAEVIELGLNHEQQHQELSLTDLKRPFSRNPLLHAYRQGWPPVPVNRSPSGWLAWPGGLVDAGTSAGSFAFDNERPQHRVYLEPFELALAPGQPRRGDRVHRGRWLPSSGTLAVGRLGRHPAARLGGTALLAIAARRHTRQRQYGQALADIHATRSR